MMHTCKLIVTEEEKQLYLQFYNVHKNRNIFQSLEMYDLLLSVPEYSPGIVVLIKENKIVASVLFNLIRSKGITGPFSCRCIIQGGPLCNSPKDAVILFQFLFKIFKYQPVYTEIRDYLQNKFLLTELAVMGFQYHEHYTVINDLKSSEAELYNKLSKNRKENIRKSIVSGVTTQNLQAYEAVQLIHKTYNKLNIPRPPAELFLNAEKYLKDKVEIFGATIGTNQIGVRIFLKDEDRIFDWYAGSDREFYKYYPNDIIPWNYFIKAKNEGYTLYDFLGAGEPSKPYGVRDYKLRFGGNLVTYGRYKLIHKPILYKIGIQALKIKKLTNENPFRHWSSGSRSLF